MNGVVKDLFFFPSVLLSGQLVLFQHLGSKESVLFLQAYRHLYVLATEARWIQTVDVDTGLPVYAPLEVTVRETEHFAETSYFEVTPCILPERATVSFTKFQFILKFHFEFWWMLDFLILQFLYSLLN